MAEPSAAVVDLTKLHESDDGADDEISSIISSTAKARALVDLLLDLSLGSYVMHNFAELICRNTASVYIQYDAVQGIAGLPHVVFFFFFLLLLCFFPFCLLLAASLQQHASRGRV